MKIAAAMLTTSLAAVFFCAGCLQTESQTKIENLQKELDLSKAREKELTTQVEKLTADTDRQKEQIETLQNLGPDRLKKLFVVDQVQLGRYTGGIDTDKKPGQDAVKVFVMPVDQAGSVIKSAGEVKIQLFDLAEPESERLIAEFDYPVDKIGEHWSSGFMAYHYSFECPLPNRPKNPDITVRVEFIDYLTGKTFTAQKLIKLILPPAP